MNDEKRTALARFADAVSMAIVVSFAAFVLANLLRGCV